MIFVIFSVHPLLYPYFEEVIRSLQGTFFSIQFKEDYHIVASMRSNLNKNKFACFLWHNLYSKLMKHVSKAQTMSFKKAFRIVKFQNKLLHKNEDFRTLSKHYLDANTRTILSIKTNEKGYIRIFKQQLIKFGLDKEENSASSLISFSYYVIPPSLPAGLCNLSLNTSTEKSHNLQAGLSNFHDSFTNITTVNNNTEPCHNLRAQDLMPYDSFTNISTVNNNAEPCHNPPAQDLTPHDSFTNISAVNNNTEPGHNPPAQDHMPLDLSKLSINPNHN